MQEATIQTFSRIERFVPTGEAALMAYLRQAVMNRIRDELRRAKRRPLSPVLDADPASAEPSPQQSHLGSQAVERYERALASLREPDREAIVARLEMGLTNEELAVSLRKPSANAARMAVERAVLRLAREMRRVSE